MVTHTEQVMLQVYSMFYRDKRKKKKEEKTDLSMGESPGPEYLSPVPLSRDACLGRSPP